VTGEIAEYIASDLLGLTLAPARTPGYDAIRYTVDGPERIQIKGRAYGIHSKRSQRISRIKTDAACDWVLLVLLDNRTLDPREMWQAPFRDVAARLALGGKSRGRGAVGVSEFKAIAQRIWPISEVSVGASTRTCPECGHAFQGKGFGGFDAHWKAKHSHVMPYEQAWPMVREGTYPAQQSLSVRASGHRGKGE
jgi:hypothetical protein